MPKGAVIVYRYLSYLWADVSGMKTEM